MTPADFELAVAERRPWIAARPSLVEAAADVAAHRPPLTLGRATDLLETLSTRLCRACPSIDHIEISGDVRRYAPLVTNLSVVARAADPERVISAVEQVPDVTDVAFRTGRRAVLTFVRS